MYTSSSLFFHYISNSMLVKRTKRTDQSLKLVTNFVTPKQNKYLF